MEQENLVCRTDDQQAVTLGAVELFEQIDAEAQGRILDLLVEILDK